MACLLKSDRQLAKYVIKFFPGSYTKPSTKQRIYGNNYRRASHRYGRCNPYWNVDGGRIVVQ